jgi:hypothetical protein
LGDPRNIFVTILKQRETLLRISPIGDKTLAMAGRKKVDNPSSDQNFMMKLSFRTHHSLMPPLNEEGTFPQAPSGLSLGILAFLANNDTPFVDEDEEQWIDNCSSSVTEESNPDLWRKYHMTHEEKVEEMRKTNPKYKDPLSALLEEADEFSPFENPEFQEATEDLYNFVGGNINDAESPLDALMYEADCFNSPKVDNTEDLNRFAVFKEDIDILPGPSELISLISQVHPKGDTEIQKEAFEQKLFNLFRSAVKDLIYTIRPVVEEVRENTGKVNLDQWEISMKIERVIALSEAIKPEVKRIHPGKILGKLYQEFYYKLIVYRDMVVRLKLKAEKRGWSVVNET